MARKVLFLGSDAFSVACLQSVLQVSSLVSVICPSPELPLAKLCKANKLPCFVPEDSSVKMKDWPLLKVPELTQPHDFIVSSSFGHLIPQSLIKRASHSINVHPSLLPRHRGASPIQYTLLSRDSNAGVSLISLSSTFDKGRVYNQALLSDCDLSNETYETLLPKLANLAGQMLKDSIIDFPSLDATAKSQDESQVTLAPKLSTEQARLRFDCSAEQLYAKFRAMKGFCNTYAFFNGKKVIPLAFRRASEQELMRLASYSRATPGSMWLLYPGIGRKEAKKFIKAVGNSVYIKATDGWLVLEDLQFECKPRSSTAMTEFICTYFSSAHYISQDIEAIPIVELS